MKKLKTITRGDNMSFGITIEKYTYASDILYCCCHPAFFEFFKEKEGNIETCKRYFYSGDVIRELIQYLHDQHDDFLEERISWIEEELNDPNNKYMVHFG